MASKFNAKKSDAPACNIQSYIRIRPLAPKERRAAVLEIGKKDIHIKATSAESSKLSKTLVFDRVFDEESKQIVVYNTIVKPMIKEVLQGYNCTVFAYGQTGTGKTYTMTGEQGDEENIHAGIVPRALQDLFAELAIQTCEYQVSVSYMELYNEKLRSLLKDSVDDPDIKLIDDPEGGVMVKGLLPTPVKSKMEAFQLLQQGGERRQVAATQMNMNSSRSHTIFTINVNIKESVVAGKDDILRCGKLHLVDLAGSENVSKSGASETIHKSVTGVNKRLAEASNINKSLLTLGRVITCLTESHSHIPYRESKLTRFLRDSLGGKTKTCIIGTISPAQANLDETESTLNYACKARSIKNKPEKNQTISKKNFLQLASEEILKLKKDLEAVRQGEGFYISKESHEDMITRMKELDEQVKDWHQKYSFIKQKYEETKELFSALSSDYDDKSAEYEELENVFRIESAKCKEKLSDFAKEIVVREYFIKEYEKTEDSLTEQAKTCKSVLENLLEQSNRLHDKIDRKQSNESENIEMLLKYKAGVSHKVAEFQSKLDTFLNEEKQFVKCVNGFAGKLSDVTTEETAKVVASISSFEERMKDIAQSVEEKSLKLENSFVHEIEASQALKEEILQQSISLYRDFIQSQVLPSMKNIQDQMGLVAKTAKEGRHQFSMYEARQAELISKIKENHVSLTKTLQTVMTEMTTIKQRNVKVAANAGSIQTCTDDATQMINEALENIKQLQKHVEMAQTKIVCISSKASSVLEDTTAVEEAVALQTTAQLDFDTYGSNHSEFLQAVNKVSQDRTDYQNSFCCQIEENTDKLLAEEDAQFRTIQSTVDENIDQMEIWNSKEKENHSKLQSVTKQFSEYLLETKAVYGDHVKQFVEDTKTVIKEQECCLDSVLREQATVAHYKLQEMDKNDNKLGEVIEDLNQNLKSITYSEYIPIGTTPQRISKDKLEYPRKFDSTAPRAELIRKMRERYPETESVPNETLELKKLLPAGPFFNGEIRVSTESSPSSVKSAQASAKESDAEYTPQTRAHTLKRRSTSMPDLNSALDETFVVPSLIENKENTRSRSAKKGVKSKIATVAKPKKTVLGAVQETNSTVNMSH